MAFNKEEKGINCHINEDGSRTCKSYLRLKNGEKVFDGQEVTIDVNPETSCSPRYIGDYDVLDKDHERIDRMTKKMVAGCKKGQLKQGYTK